MTTTATRRAPAAAPPSPSPSPQRRRAPWGTAVASGVAVLLAGVPVSSVVQGSAWFGDAVLVVAAVVAVGLALHRAGTAVVAVGQLVAVLVVLTARYTASGIAGVLPGPAAWREFGALAAGAGDQIAVGIAPVPATPEILFLVTGAFGLVAVGVYLAAVGAAAPAAGGVPLLAMFAVPAALADELLPWWSFVGATAGFGVLLLSRSVARRELSGGAALVAGSVVVALLVGAGSGFIGTSGRFAGGGSGAGGSIGLSPFTALRGQLTQNTPAELFRVRGLPKATYLRALTLRDYVPNAGWQATRPDPGPALPGLVLPALRGKATTTTIDVENIGFKDYWLPIYGTPVDITGLPVGEWTYDQRSGTAYTARPRQDGPWQERASLAEPTAEQLRAAAGGRGNPGAEYVNVAGVDPRVTRLAAQVVAGKDTAFDKAIALQEFFTGSSSAFRYSLQTAPGGGDDALVEFLTVGRAGYCEQFASAMAVMLRTVGVPARVAVGFTGGTDGEGYRSITTADAHAWVEAWFPGVGWTTFDPTPLTDGRTVTPPYVAEAQAQAGPDGTTGADNPAQDPKQATPTTAPENPAPATPDPTATDPNASGPLVWPFAVLAGLLLAAGVALVPVGLRHRARRRRLGVIAGGGPDAAGAAWAEVLAESRDRGAPTPPTDTVRSGARRLVQEHHLDGDAQQALRTLVGAVEESWYGGVQPAPGALAGPLHTVTAAIAADRELTLRERLLPRSVIRDGLRSPRRESTPV